jgi:hypothetical protein
MREKNQFLGQNNLIFTTLGAFVEKYIAYAPRCLNVNSRGATGGKGVIAYVPRMKLKANTHHRFLQTIHIKSICASQQIKNCLAIPLSFGRKAAF